MAHKFFSILLPSIAIGYWSEYNHYLQFYHHSTRRCTVPQLSPTIESMLQSDEFDLYLFPSRQYVLIAVAMANIFSSHQQQPNKKFLTRIFYSFALLPSPPFSAQSFKWTAFCLDRNVKMSRKFFNCDRIMQIACCIMCIKSKCEWEWGCVCVRWMVFLFGTSNERTRDAEKKPNDAETCEPEHRQFMYSIFICTLNMLSSSFVETVPNK